MQAPVISSVSCSQNASAYNVMISWEPIQESTFFYAGVFDAQQQVIAHEVINSVHGSNVANLQKVILDPNTNYIAMVAQCNGSGELTSAYSTPLNVLQSPVGDLETVNNLDTIDISATLPAVGNPTGMRIDIYDANFQAIVSDAVIAGSYATLTPEIPLKPDGVYTVYAKPVSNAGSSQGVSSTSQLVMTQCAISKVTYDGKNLTITANSAVPEGQNLYGRLSANERLLTDNVGSDSSVTLQEIAEALNLAKTHTVLIRAELNGSLGIASEQEVIVVTTPRLLSAVYNGEAVSTTWEAYPAAPTPNGGKVAVTINGSVKGTPDETLGYQSTITIPAAEPGDALKVQVNSLYGCAYGPPAATELPTTKPAIGSVSVSNGTITLDWSDSASEQDAALGYRVSLLDSTGKTITTCDTSDNHAALPALIDPDTAYSVSVMVHGLNSDGVEVSGAPSVSVPVVAAVPTITLVDYNGTTTTVQWQAIDPALGINGYTATLYDAETGQPVEHGSTSVNGAESTQADIPLTLDVYKRYAVKVQATGGNSRGAFSEAVTVLNTAPEVTAADISAATVSLAWQLDDTVPVTGYTVTLSDEAAEANVKTLQCTGNTLRFANDLDPGQIHVSVSACASQGNGPSGPTVNLFGDKPSFYSQNAGDLDTNPDNNNAERPSLVRCATNQAAATDIVFAFPELYTSTPASLPSVGIFTLVANADSSIYPYKLTVAADSSAWKFDTASRSSLAGDFQNFLKALEKPDANTVLIKPGALTMVQQSLAMGLPLLYEEILGYLYSFNPAGNNGGYVDLLPGMRLRVDSEVYQSTPPNNNQSGYVTNGSATFEIHSYTDAGELYTGFDAFLSQLQRPEVPSPFSGSGINGGGGGIVDLYNSAGRLPYYRLLYPATLHGTTYTNPVNQSYLPVILGAQDYNTLVAATDQYVSSGNFTGLSGIYPFFFRGRAMPVPELPVTLNGQKQWLPLGSTVANLLAKEGGLPGDVSAAIDGFCMQRAIGSLNSDTTASSVTTDALNTNRVRLEYARSTFSPTQPGFFGLPLQIGDLITLSDNSGN